MFMPKMVPTFQYVGLFYSALSDNRHCSIPLLQWRPKSINMHILLRKNRVAEEGGVHCTMFTQTALFLSINKRSLKRRLG
jgi:hypothetical protein